MASVSDAKGGSSGRSPLGDAIEHRLVVVELCETLRRLRTALVGDIVGGAGEMVDRNDGRTQRGRRKPRRDGKVFVMSDRHGIVHLLEP